MKLKINLVRIGSTNCDFFVYNQHFYFEHIISSKMNRTHNDNHDDYQVDPEIVNGFQSLKMQHRQFFESLEHRLISKSSKFTNFMGANHSSIHSKAQSEHLSDHSDSFTQSPMKKPYESSSVSPIKNKFELLKKTILQKKAKSKVIYQQPATMNNAVQKLIQLKDDIVDQRNKSRSSISSLQDQQRKLAYDLDFTLSQINIEQVNEPKQHHNVKQIYQLTYEQKKKLTQTISTTSSYKFPKLQAISTSQQFESKVTLKDFQILKPLGEGKFGTVFLARHIKSNFLCAIKRMPKIFEQQSIVQQLIREIKIQSFLDHPNICQLYTYFLEEEFIYLVLELCNSGNVYNVLRKQGRFPQEKVKSIIRQVCHAIEYLHQHDIIHRDIKPQNIIFHENVIKICDFGWSVYAPLSRGTLCGTPIYASPELVQKKQYDSKLDIWNIGILTYQLLYGRVPFEIRCQEDLQKVIDEEIYFPKSIQISDHARDFIRQSLNKNPKYRITIMKMLDHDFLFQKDRKN